METELEAVNYLLDVLGSPPVGDLEVLHPDLVTCQTKLKDSSKLIQQAGYWFNRDYGVVVEPDATSLEIIVPSDVLKVVTVYDRFSIQRGTKLYDSVNNTYQFDSSRTMDFIRLLEWDLLPLSVQNAIKYHAAVQVCNIDLEDNNKANSQNSLYIPAITQVRAEDLEITRRNMRETPQVARMRQRVRPYHKRNSGLNPTYAGG